VPRNRVLCQSPVVLTALARYRKVWWRPIPVVVPFGCARRAPLLLSGLEADQRCSFIFRRSNRFKTPDLLVGSLLFHSPLPGSRTYLCQAYPTLPKLRTSSTLWEQNDYTYSNLCGSYHSKSELIGRYRAYLVRLLQAPRRLVGSTPSSDTNTRQLRFLRDSRVTHTYVCLLSWYTALVSAHLGSPAFLTSAISTS
jgi:hypothetical protein